MMPVTFAASEVLKAIDGCDCYQISMFDLIHTNKVQLKRSPVWSETIDRPMHNEGDNTYVGYSCPVTMHRFAITVFIFEDDFSFTTWKNGKRTTIRCCLDGEMWGWVLNGGWDGIVGMRYCAAEIHVWLWSRLLSMGTFVTIPSSPRGLPSHQWCLVYLRSPDISC